jgi:hypothetical protein
VNTASNIHVSVNVKVLVYFQKFNPNAVVYLS